MSFSQVIAVVDDAAANVRLEAALNVVAWTIVKRIKNVAYIVPANGAKCSTKLVDAVAPIVMIQNGDKPGDKAYDYALGMLDACDGKVSMLDVHRTLTGFRGELSASYTVPTTPEQKAAKSKNDEWGKIRNPDRGGKVLLIAFPDVGQVPSSAASGGKQSTAVQAKAGAAAQARFGKLAAEK